MGNKFHESTTKVTRHFIFLARFFSLFCMLFSDYLLYLSSTRCIFSRARYWIINSSVCEWKKLLYFFSKGICILFLVFFDKSFSFFLSLRWVTINSWELSRLLILFKDRNRTRKSTQHVTIFSQNKITKFHFFMNRKKLNKLLSMPLKAMK